MRSKTSAKTRARDGFERASTGPTKLALRAGDHALAVSRTRSRPIVARRCEPAPPPAKALTTTGHAARRAKGRRQRPARAPRAGSRTRAASSANSTAQRERPGNAARSRFAATTQVVPNHPQPPRRRWKRGPQGHGSPCRFAAERQSKGPRSARYQSAGAIRARRETNTSASGRTADKPNAGIKERRAWRAQSQPSAWIDARLRKDRVQGLEQAERRVQGSHGRDAGD